MTLDLNKARLGAFFCFFSAASPLVDALLFFTVFEDPLPALLPLGMIPCWLGLGLGLQRGRLWAWFGSLAIFCLIILVALLSAMHHVLIMRSAGFANMEDPLVPIMIISITVWSVVRFLTALIAVVVLLGAVAEPAEQSQIASDEPGSESPQVTNSDDDRGRAERRKPTSDGAIKRESGQIYRRG